MSLAPAHQEQVTDQIWVSSFEQEEVLHVPPPADVWGWVEVNGQPPPADVWGWVEVNGQLIFTWN